MYTPSQLSRTSIGAAVGLMLLTVSACSGADSTASVEAAVNNFCQNEQQLTPGTAEYEKCVVERTDYVRQNAAKAAIF